MLLAIDTSTDWSGLALYEDGVVLGDVSWRSARHHTEQVLAQLELLCVHLERRSSDLSAVAVATGPGSWAGLRVGMSLAKAIAVGLGLPLIGVPTHEIWAWSHRYAAEAVLVVIRLGRGRYAVAQFDATLPPCAGPVQPQVCDLHAVPLVHGLYIGDVDAELRAHVGTIGRWATPADNVRHPAALAEIAAERLAVGDHDDVVALQPIYLSSPVRE